MTDEELERAEAATDDDLIKSLLREIRYGRSILTEIQAIATEEHNRDVLDWVARLTPELRQASGCPENEFSAILGIINGAKNGGKDNGLI